MPGPTRTADSGSSASERWRSSPTSTAPAPARADVELLLAGLAFLVVGLRLVVGRQVHDVGAERGQAEAGPDEVREAVPERGHLVVAGGGVGRGHAVEAGIGGTAWRSPRRRPGCTVPARRATCPGTFLKLVSTPCLGAGDLDVGAAQALVDGLGAGAAALRALLELLVDLLAVPVLLVGDAEHRLRVLLELAALDVLAGLVAQRVELGLVGARRPFAFASIEPLPASAITARTHSSAAAARSSASLVFPCQALPCASCEPSGDVCAVDARDAGRRGASPPAAPPAAHR